MTLLFLVAALIIFIFATCLMVSGITKKAWLCSMILMKCSLIVVVATVTMPHVRCLEPDGKTWTRPLVSRVKPDTGKVVSPSGSYDIGRCIIK